MGLIESEANETTGDCSVENDADESGRKLTKGGQAARRKETRTATVLWNLAQTTQTTRTKADES